MRIKPAAAVVLGAMAATIVAERLWPLRPRREPQSRHLLRDLAMGAMSAAATNALQSLLLRPVSRRLESERLGLLGSLRLPKPLRIAAGVLLLDYTLWSWHALNHRVPFLWRFHRVHHADLDLDAATGARFHAGEMSMSVVFRWLQLRIIGPDPLATSIWQTMLLSSIFFHHSNTRLPLEADNALTNVFATPRMHGIHHSIVKRETDSNFASLFTWWDMLHGTLLVDVPQAEITIGIPEFQQPEDVTLGRILVMPFTDRDAPAPSDLPAPSPAPR